MKKYFLIICIMALCLPLLAQRMLKHQVVLKNGTILRGNLVTNDNPDIITIKTADFSLYSYTMTEVQEINNTKWSERWRFPYDRPLGVFLRPELGIGLGCSASLSFGLQIGPYYAMYGGVGTNLVCTEIPPEQYYNWNCIFIANRLYISPKKNSFYLDCRFGTGLSHLEFLYFDELTLSNSHTYTYTYQPNNQGGVFYSLGTGYSFGPLEIGLCLFNVLSKDHYLLSHHHTGKYHLSLCFTLAYNLRRHL